MGSIKKTPARKESSKLSAGSNDQVPLLVNKHDATTKSIKQQTTKADEEYKRVKVELANESLKLQRLTERRITSQALSDPNASNIDRMFSMDSVGRYLYIGTNGCCFDAISQAYAAGRAPNNSPCKHDLCARARSSSISWTELDTIKWYDMRIRHEKTSRMRSALAKQRHVELARLKKSEDEENAKHARRHKERIDVTNQQIAHKPGSGTGDHLDPQDLDTVVFEARISTMHIYRYNVFVCARQQAMAVIAKQSDVVSMLQLHKATRCSNCKTLEEQLQKAQFRSQKARKDAEWFEEKIAEAASASTVVADWQDFNLDLDFDGANADAIELCTLVNWLLTELGTPVDAIDNIENAQSTLRHIMSLPMKKKSLKVQIAMNHIQKIVCKVQKRPKHVQASSLGSSYTSMSSSLVDLRNVLISVLHDESADLEHLDPIYSELVRIEDDAKREVHQVYQRLFKSPSELARSLAKIKSQAVAKSPMPKITQILLDIVISIHNDMSQGHAIVKDLDQIDTQILFAKISGLVFARAEKKAEWLIPAFTAIEAIFEIIHVEGPLPDRVQRALQRVKASVEARGKASQKAAAASKKPEDSAREFPILPIDPSPKQTSAQNVICTVDDTFPNLAMGNDEPFTAHEKSIINMSELYSAETASMYTMHLFRHKYCPGCATLRISQLVAALLMRNPSQMTEIVAALTAGHPVSTGEGICTEAPEDLSKIDTWRPHVCHGVQCIAEMYDMLASLPKTSCSIEEDANFIGTTIVKILRGIVLDIDPEEALTQLSTMDWDSSQRLSLEFLLEKVLNDETFYCSVCGDPCFRRVSRLSPKGATVSEPDVSSTSTHSLSKGSRSRQGEAHPGTTANVIRASISTAPGSMTVSIVPGPPRRKLLPRGKRHQNHYNAMKAAAKIACLSISTAKKMSEFLVFQQKAYERAGLALSPKVLNCMENIRRTAYAKPSTQSQGKGECQCDPCVAARLKSAEKTSKFLEDLSEIDRSRFDVTIAGRAITEDELLGYTNATVERIRSIGSGEAQLEYICWVAYKVSLEADAAHAAGKKWTLPVKQFEEFFTHHALMPRSLELALDYAKGYLWPSPDCLKNYPTAEWPVIDDILTFMGRFSAKELTFAPDNDETWHTPSSIFPASGGVISDEAAKENLLQQEADVSAAVDQMFSDPVMFERLMEGWRTRLLTADDSDISEVDATVEQVRKLFGEGSIEVCKELVLAGVMCAQSAQQVKNASFAISSDNNLVPLPLNVRKDWLEGVIRAESPGESINEASDVSEKHNNTNEQEQMGLMRLQFERETRQKEAIQAQLDVLRQSDGNIETPSETTPATEKFVQDLFRSYHASARPLIDYLASFSTEDLRDERKHEDDPNIMIGGRFQMQYFDCMRMLQLMAENRGWNGTAFSMKQRIENCGDLYEDEEGHYPDYWDDDDEDEEEEEEEESLGDKGASRR